MGSARPGACGGRRRSRVLMTSCAGVRPNSARIRRAKRYSDRRASAASSPRAAGGRSARGRGGRPRRGPPSNAPGGGGVDVARGADEADDGAVAAADRQLGGDAPPLLRGRGRGAARAGRRSHGRCGTPRGPGRGSARRAAAGKRSRVVRPSSSALLAQAEAAHQRLVDGDVAPRGVLGEEHDVREPVEQLHREAGGRERVPRAQSIAAIVSSRARVVRKAQARPRQSYKTAGARCGLP